MALSASSSMAAQLHTLPHSHHHRLLLSSPPLSSAAFTSRSNGFRLSLPLRPTNPKNRKISTSSSSVVKASANSMVALIFDCDGVILESEDLHRQAYNDAFAFFNVRCPSSSLDGPLDWDIEFYDVLQNQIGGGKPKMRWYFKEHGWPTSTIFETPPDNDTDRSKLIDIIQDWKTERYQEIIKSGSVQPRPGVLRLMDEAKAAGDDVKEKKPDPSIYLAAAKKLGVSADDCLVVEDSVIGLKAATKAGMPCVITYTPSTSTQDFTDAIATYPDLSSVRLSDLEALLQNVVAAG